MGIRLVVPLVKDDVCSDASSFLGEPNMSPKNDRKPKSRSFLNRWYQSFLGAKWNSRVVHHVVRVLLPVALLALQYLLNPIGLHATLELGEHRQQHQVPTSVFGVSPDSFVDKIQDEASALQLLERQRSVLKRSEDTIPAIDHDHIPRPRLPEDLESSWPLEERNLEATYSLIGYGFQDFNIGSDVTHLHLRGFDILGLKLQRQARVHLLGTRYSNVTPQSLDACLLIASCFSTLWSDVAFGLPERNCGSWVCILGIHSLAFLDDATTSQFPDRVSLPSSEAKHSRIVLGQHSHDRGFKPTPCCRKVDVLANEMQVDILLKEPIHHGPEVTYVSKHSIDRPADHMISRIDIFDQDLSSWTSDEFAFAISTHSSVYQNPARLVLRPVARSPCDVWYDITLVPYCRINLTLYRHRTRNGT